MSDLNQSNSRLHFIDVARSLAIILMLQGHFISLTFEDYTIWSEAVKENGTSGNVFFDYWRELRKYTAPLFFTITGLVLGYLLMGHKGESFWKQKRVSKGWRRGLTIIMWGYILQLNYKNLDYYLKGKIGDHFFNFHVLHCIGFGILFLIVLYAIHHYTKKIKFSLILFIAGLAVFLFYPVIRSYSSNPIPPGAHLGIQNMFNGPGAVFPFFPHLGFIFFGASIGALFREYSKYIKKIWFPALFVISFYILIILLKQLIMYIIDENFTSGHFNRYFWTFDRLKVIILFIGILMYAEQFIKLKAPFFIKMGQNTLNIYIIHSMLLYGAVIGIGVRTFYEKSLSFGESVIGAALFILFFGVMTHFQPHIKRVLLYFPRMIFPQKNKT